MMVDCQKEWGFCSISALLLYEVFKHGTSLSPFAPSPPHHLNCLRPVNLEPWEDMKDAFELWWRWWGRVAEKHTSGASKRNSVDSLAREPHQPPPTPYTPSWSAPRALQDSFLKKSRLTPSAPLLNEIPTLSRCQTGKPEIGHRAGLEVWGFVTGPLLTDQAQ